MSTAIFFHAVACVVLCVTVTLAAPEVNDRLRRRPEVFDNSMHAGIRSVKQQPIDRHRRASSFVRIGKSQNRDVEDFEGLGVSDGDVSDEHYSDKKASSFVRIGKALSDEQGVLSYETEDRPNKRASSFIRIGRQSALSSSLPSSSSTSSRRSDDSSRKRMSSFVRIGKRRPYSAAAADVSAITEKEPESLAVWSSETEVDCSKNSIADVRCQSLGVDKGEPVAVPEKKASSFIRIGRNSVNDE